MLEAKDWSRTLHTLSQEAHARDLGRALDRWSDHYTATDQAAENAAEKGTENESH